LNVVYIISQIYEKNLKNFYFTFWKYISICRFLPPELYGILKELEI